MQRLRFIYIVRNLINCKVYIGQTVNFQSRKIGHLCAARNNGQSPLYRSMRKHGIENFKFEILEECEDSRVDEREIYWIAFFNSRNSKKGYNIDVGGRSTTKKIHRKISEALKGNTSFKNHRHSLETKMRIRSKLIGHISSEKAIQKLRELNKKRVGPANPMFNRRGEDHPRSKLTNHQRQEIVDLLSTMNNIELAIRYNVSRITISRIRKQINAIVEESMADSPV